MTRFATIIAVLILGGCGSAQPLPEGFEDERPSKASVQTLEGRYSDDLFIASVSIGGYRHSRAGAEKGWWLSPEFYARPFDLWRAAVGIGDIRANARASFSQVEGSFDAGTKRVNFKQDRIDLGIGPNFLWSSEKKDLGFEVNALYQGEFEQEMKRDDGEPGERGYINKPEGRVVFWHSHLPMLFDWSRDGYNANEVVANYKPGDGVAWVRLTSKVELIALDCDMARFSLRAGPRYEAYGGRSVPIWLSQAGGYGEVFSRIKICSHMVPFSLDFFGGHGLPDHDIGGWVFAAGGFVAVTY